MSGDAPVTTTVSARAPAATTRSTTAVSVPESATAVRCGDVPPTENVTSYGPGRRSSIRYRPPRSVTAARDRSISTSLAARTSTPATGSPDDDVTLPAMAACAHTRLGLARTHVQTRRTFM